MNAKVGKDFEHRSKPRRLFRTLKLLKEKFFKRTFIKFLKYRDQALIRGLIREWLKEVLLRLLIVFSIGNLQWILFLGRNKVIKEILMLGDENYLSVVFLWFYFYFFLIKFDWKIFINYLRKSDFWDCRGDSQIGDQFAV